MLVQKNGILNRLFAECMVRHRPRCRDVLPLLHLWPNEPKSVHLDILDRRSNRGLSCDKQMASGQENVTDGTALWGYIPRKSSVYNLGPNDFSLEYGPNWKFSPGAKHLARAVFLMMFNCLEFSPEFEISPAVWNFSQELEKSDFPVRVKFQTIGVRRYGLVKSTSYSHTSQSHSCFGSCSYTIWSIFDEANLFSEMELLGFFRLPHWSQCQSDK